MRERLLTVAEVAAILRVKVATVQRHIREGHLPAAMVGRQYLLREQDVDAYVDALFADAAANGSATEAQASTPR